MNGMSCAPSLSTARLALSPPLVGRVAFIVIGLLLPLLSIVVFSFWRTESYELFADWSLDNYRVLFGEAAYRTFFLRSLVTAVVTLPDLVCGWPVAYYIARYGGRRLLLLVLLAAPFFTGAILRIAAPAVACWGRSGDHGAQRRRPAADRDADVPRPPPAWDWSILHPFMVRRRSICRWSISISAPGVAKSARSSGGPSSR